MEAARLALEEKAEQLALSSKYKSEFLANMSHELRTPLNSLLILARLLSDNKDGNLTPKQVEFAQTILLSGSDLLKLINDVLDLSKVEAGKMDVNPTDVRLTDVKEFVERSFSAVADQKGLGFTWRSAGDLPQTIYTDGQRLQQVLKNLLSNAFKFTQQGDVTLTVRARTRAGASRTRRSNRRGSPRVRRHRHRDRNREGQAAPDIRSVPAGGRNDEPQVRRHGSRPVDQPRDCAAARRRDPRREHAGTGQHLHPVPALALRTPGCTTRCGARCDIHAAVADVGSSELAQRRALRTTARGEARLSGASRRR